MIPGDLLSAFPHRQFHTLPRLLDSWAALPNSYPNACMPMQGGSLYHFYDGLWYDPAERRTHDLPCERRTRYRLSQPDTTVFVSCRFLIVSCRKCTIFLLSVVLSAFSCFRLQICQARGTQHARCCLRGCVESSRVPALTPPSPAECGRTGSQAEGCRHTTPMCADPKNEDNKLSHVSVL